MFVPWLELRDFRCYEALTFEPEPAVNVLIGENGSGKTSVLEAIAYAASGKSFRRSPDAALIRAGADSGIVRVGVEGSVGEGKIEISIPTQGRRQVLVNGKRPKDHAELARTLPVVAFLPDDLELVKGGPGLRRDFIDDLAAQLWPQAGAAQGELSRSLRQRNTLLRQEGRRADPMTLSVWDERVAASGGEVMVHRLHLLESLGPVLQRSYGEVGEGATLEFIYRSRWADGAPADDAESFKTALQDALEESRSRDMDVRVTTTGPHRDEPILELESRTARTRASQGEQRSVALALRLASYRLLEERHKAAPVLLLDDVFSELDVGRSEGVMRILPLGQVFVTSAREDEVPVAGRRWRVGEGSVI